MARLLEEVACLVTEEVSAISDQLVREALRLRLQTPSRHLREWDYGAPGEQYECWTVALDRESDTALVYSEHGFGPAHPWGLVSASNLCFGMDSGWFLRLADAFLESSMAAELPVWNVVAEGRSETMARSLRMDDAFHRQDEFVKNDPVHRYHVVYRGRLPEGVS